MSTKLQKHFLEQGGLENDLTVSQEGMLGDALGWIRGLFQYRPKDHNKLMEKALGNTRQEIESHAKLKNLLVKCFTNDRWLDSHELVQGSIAGTYVAGGLRFGEEDFKDPYKAVFVHSDQVLNQISSVANAATLHMDYIYSRYKQLIRDCKPYIEMVRDDIDDEEQKERTAKAIAGELGTTTTRSRHATIDVNQAVPAMFVRPKIDRFIAELEYSAGAKSKSPAYYWDSKRPIFQLFRGRRESGGYKSRIVRSTPIAGDPPAVPALTRDQIKYLAQLLLSWLDKGYLNNGTWVLAHQMDLKSAHRVTGAAIRPSAWDPDEEDFDPSDDEIFWFIASSSKSYRQLEDLVDTDKVLIDWQNNSELFETLQHAAVAIVHWMAGSIKGRLPSVS